MTPSHREFLNERLGDNWVLVHKRSRAPLYDRHGRLQQQVTGTQLRAAEREWREMYGDPHDKIRADLYRALKALVRDPNDPVVRDIARIALAAEVDR